MLQYLVGGPGERVVESVYTMHIHWGKNYTCCLEGSRCIKHCASPLCLLQAYAQRIDWQDIILRPVSNKTKKKAAGLGMPAKKENGREADVSIGILSLGVLDNGER